VGPRAGLDTETTGKVPCLCRGSNIDRSVVKPVLTELPGTLSIIRVMFIYYLFTYLFIVHLMALSVAQTPNERIIRE
jgi:hypothetical protein